MFLYVDEEILGVEYGFRKSSHAMLGTTSKVQLKGTGWIYPHQVANKGLYIHTMDSRS